MINNISEDIVNKLLEDIKTDKIQKIVLGAVILIENNSPLLLKRTQNDFMGGLVELPSGTLEPQEDMIMGLIREVKEETGLDIKSIDFFIGSFDYLSSSGKKTRQINFKVTTYEKNIKLSEEHDNYFIYSINSKEYENLNISSKTKNIVEKAILLNNK